MLKDDLMISQNYAKEYYLSLKIDEKSDDLLFNKVIEIFQDRIEGRFLNLIKQMLSDEYNNGFAIMALNCLLIDTFRQFCNPNERRNSNRQSYISFLQTELSSIFDYTKARLFYEGIRCGILHSAETGENTVLTLNTNDALTVEKSKLIVDVGCFTACLFEYYDQYVSKLKDKTNEELRRKFIIKMNHIANK